MAAMIILCIAVIILAIAAPKPAGWVALGISALSLLMVALRWNPF